jgi:hypothetical protein
LTASSVSYAITFGELRRYRSAKAKSKEGRKMEIYLLPGEERRENKKGTENKTIELESHSIITPLT